MGRPGVLVVERDLERLVGGRVEGLHVELDVLRRDARSRPARRTRPVRRIRPGRREAPGVPVAVPPTVERGGSQPAVSAHREDAARGPSRARGPSASAARGPFSRCPVASASTVRCHSLPRVVEPAQERGDQEPDPDGEDPAREDQPEEEQEDADRGEDRPERRARHVDARAAGRRGRPPAAAGAPRPRGRTRGAPRGPRRGAPGRSRSARRTGADPGRPARGAGGRRRPPRRTGRRSGRACGRRPAAPARSGRPAPAPAGPPRTMTSAQTKKRIDEDRHEDREQRDQRAPVGDDELGRQLEDAVPEVLEELHQRSPRSGSAVTRSTSRRRGRRPSAPSRSPRTMSIVTPA